MEPQQLCFQCLQDRIRSDFSDKVVFCHGIPDSDIALPFGCKAIVKVESAKGEGSTELLLVYRRSSRDDCITKYIDEHIVRDAKDYKDHAIKKSSANEYHESVNYTENGAQSSSIASPAKRSVVNGGKTCILEMESGDNSSRQHSCFSMITAMAPCAQVGSSYSILDNLASNLLSGSIEDDALCSFRLLIEGEMTSCASKNFLSMIGVPSFSDEYVPGCLRHPNLYPVLGILKAAESTCLVYPSTPYTLENILHYSPEALRSEWHLRFLIYQLLSALAFIHGLGSSHGNISPSNIMLTDSCWVWLSLWLNCSSDCQMSAKVLESTVPPPARKDYCSEGCVSHTLFTSLSLSPAEEWHTSFYKWWRGDMSNFEYLLVLNRLAGRRWGDQTFHTVIPGEF